MRKKEMAMIAAQAAEAVLARAKMAEEAIRAQQLDLPQSEESAHYAEATANLLQAVGEGEGVFFLGRLLVVKRRDSDGGGARAITLTAEQYRAIRESGGERTSATQLFEFIGALDESNASEHQGGRGPKAEARRRD